MLQRMAAEWSKNDNAKCDHPVDLYQTFSVKTYNANGDDDFLNYEFDNILEFPDESEPTLAPLIVVLEMKQTKHTTMNK